MNHTLGEGISFFESLPLEKLVQIDVEIVVFPSFPLIFPLRQYIMGHPIAIGGQNINENPKGAYTGEVSASILQSVGAEWVIIGHSERRDIYGESDDLIAKKTKIAIETGLKIILCVGEHLETRKEGKEIEHVKNQLEINLSTMTENEMNAVSVAYEPVWAIGTGLAATPDDAEAMSFFIREWLKKRFSREIAEKTRILYGGSVNAQNMGDFAVKANIDGALVGGASLDALSFVKIIESTLI
jgi:triosephosphate isomerase